MNNEYAHLPTNAAGVRQLYYDEAKAGTEHLLIHCDERGLPDDDNLWGPCWRPFPPHGCGGQCRKKIHFNKKLESAWKITDAKPFVTPGELPFPRGGYELTSLELRHLNNLTHKRPRGGCVDWKSIWCPQTHMSLSQRWLDTSLKRCNRFSLRGFLLRKYFRNPIREVVKRESGDCKHYRSWPQGPPQSRRNKSLLK